MASAEGNPPPTSSSTTTQSQRKSHSPLRLRNPRFSNLDPSSTASARDRRTSTPNGEDASRPRRSSSFMTVDSTFDRASFRTSPDSVSNYATQRDIQAELDADDNSSTLHSTPLVLALLPAIAGVFFKNGSAVVTDITLLGLAAIFLNWSIRGPWRWYHNAQAVRVKDSVNLEDYLGAEQNHLSDDADIKRWDDSIPEEAVEGDSPTAEKMDTAEHPQSAAREDELHEAASELRSHEFAALLACFLAPMLGTLLLHAIRSQLSRPSEGLVSNYNLSIFLLAAEIRPLSHLVKLIRRRTLYLQRVVATSPYTNANVNGTSGESAQAAQLPENVAEQLNALTTKLAALENQLPSSSTSSLLSTVNESNQATFKKQIQPDLDALNRAVRRYEKRATLLGLQMESRLNTLEHRLSDALTLAAAAERNVSIVNAKSGPTGFIGSILRFLFAPAIMVMNIITAIPKKLLLAAGEIVEIILGTRRWGTVKRRLGLDSAMRPGQNQTKPEARKAKGRDRLNGSAAGLRKSSNLAMGHGLGPTTINGGGVGARQAS